MRALDTYKQMPVPDPRLKSWSRLADQVLDDLSFHLVPKPEIFQSLLDESDHKVSVQAIISEDRLDFRMCPSATKQGVVLCDLETALENHREILESTIKEFKPEAEDKVAAFTAGLSRHGFFLYVPEKVQLEKPIEIINQIATEAVVFPVNGIVILGAQASTSLIIRERSKNKKAALISSNLTISVGDSASLRLLEIQKSSKKTWNLIHEMIVLCRNAILEYLLVDSGSAVLKRNLSAILNEEGGQATITGIYTPHSAQVYIYDTQQKHLASHTTTDLYFSGVLEEDSYSLWKGNVYVAEGTKGADGFQINKNMLMDGAAHAESIPGLEIIADDVRCSHAVTMGSVDPDQMFFLQSRGIGQAEAEALIVSGFLESASTRMKDKHLKEIVQGELI